LSHKELISKFKKKTMDKDSKEPKERLKDMVSFRVNFKAFISLIID